LHTTTPLGSTENAGPENEGSVRDQIDQRPTDMTGKRDQISRVRPENAGLENAGPKMQGWKMQDQKMWDKFHFVI